MPILAIYALIAAAIFGAGYGTAWKQGTYKIATLEASIESANKLASSALAAKAAEVEKLAAEQTITNIQLEAEHDKNIKSISTDTISLDDVRLQWAANQPSRDCAVSKAGDPRSNKTDAKGGFYLDSSELTKELNKLVPKALLADRIDEDHHFVLQFLNTLPKELTR